MLRIKDIITRIFKHSSDKQPWSNYYLEEQRDIKYTNNKVVYGEPIFLRLEYDYIIKLPLMDEQVVGMVVERNSVCKR